jgi:hypothetical protein
MLSRAQKEKIKKQALKKQRGICPICGFGRFCKECVRGAGPGHSGPHDYQEVNTFDHNHDCCQTGCAKCFRGTLHQYCNRHLQFLERHPHLQTSMIKKYLKRGSPPPRK